MPSDDQVPATKADIRMLMEQMGAYYDKTERRIADVKLDMQGWKREIMEHFNLTAENIRHDLQGAHRDDIESLKDRVVRLEQHAGFRPA